MLQLGWKAGTEQYSPDELLEYAVLAEQAGFDPGCERHENPIGRCPCFETIAARPRFY